MSYKGKAKEPPPKRISFKKEKTFKVGDDLVRRSLGTEEEKYKPRKGDSVLVRYTIRSSEDGTEIGSSDFEGHRFKVGDKTDKGLIVGLNAAVQEMTLGEHSQFYIPSAMAFKNTGTEKYNVPILPNTELLIDVWLWVIGLWPEYMDLTAIQMRKTHPDISVADLQLRLRDHYKHMYETVASQEWLKRKIVHHELERQARSRHLVELRKRPKNSSQTPRDVEMEASRQEEQDMLEEIDKLESELASLGS